jgi:type IV secretion system protein VirB9
MSARRLSSLAVCCFLALGSPVTATVLPTPAGADPRLCVVLYDPLQVVAMRGALGYQTVIEFDPAERIENVAIGDSLSWQVVPNRQANLLFLKPMARAPVTNMTVVTNMRRYAFELSISPARPGDDRDVIYELRFEYPPPVTPLVIAPQPPAPEPPEDVNHAYSYAGSTQNLPIRVFDDGHVTYFRFADDASFPAIFAVEGDNTEAVVNFRSLDGYVVVDRLARAFVLRRGNVATRIINDGFPRAQASELAPQLRHRGFHLFP